MGDTADISVELRSLEQAAAKMDSDVVAKMTSLAADWNSYLTQLKSDEWTDEDGCQPFSQAYRSAIGAYDQVMQGILKDVTRYRDELTATHAAYRDRDDAVMQEMNTRLGKLDDASEATRMGGIALSQRSDLEYQGTGTPPRPTDTSPGEENDPVTPRNMS